jgi:4-amino-4-deoxy-L-arabinose transferase-like glycosyltransferase
VELAMNESNGASCDSNSRYVAWLLFGLLALGLAYALMLFYRGLMDPDEGRYSEIPREMAVSGNWAEMRLLGYRYYEKPPLAYWSLAPSIAFFGAREWAARIPLLLNILLLSAVFYWQLRSRWPGRGGRDALLILLSMAGFFVGFCLVMTDGFLTFWFSLTCLALFEAFQKDCGARRKHLFLLLAALAALLGFLVKGAVAVVLPGLILVVWLVWEKRWRALLTPALLPAGLVFLALLTPILWWLEAHNPGFLVAFIFDEHFNRFTGARTSQLHAEPFWFYLAVAPLLLLPWTLFAVRGVRNIIRQRRLATDDLTRFFVVWVGVVLVFFSISAGKLLSYILPALPPLGLLLGRWGVAETRDDSPTDRRLWNLGLAGIWLMAAAVCAVAAVSVLRVAPKAIHPVSAGSLLLLVPLALLAGIVFGLRDSRHLPGLLSLSAGLLFTAALLLSPLGGKDFHVLFQTNSADVYKALAARLKPEDEVVVFCKYRPSLPFYLQKLPYMCYGMNELKAGLLMERGRPQYLWTRDAIRRLVAECPGRVYGVVDAKDYPKRFLPLKLNFAPAGLPADPNTIIVQLLPEVSGSQEPE